MPATLTYPGVYIEEVPSGVRTITGVATSITAFVGYTARGRDNLATRVLSFADFERLFGGLASDSVLSYSVQHFFANGGSQGYVVRVPKADSVAGAVTLMDGVEAGAKEALRVTAVSRGAWANDVIVDVDYDGVPEDDDGAFNLSITDLATLETERFTDVTMDATQRNYVVAVVNDDSRGSAMVRMEIPDATAGRPAETGTVGGDIDPENLLNDQDYKIRISSDVPAGVITNVDVAVIGVGEPVPTSVLGVCRLLERKINLALATVTNGAAVRCVPTSSGQGVRVLPDFSLELLGNAIDASLSFSAGSPSALAMVGLTSGASTINVGHYRLGQGRVTLGQSDPTEGVDGVNLPATGDLIGSESEPPTGIYALNKTDLFNILCIPDATRPTASNPAAPDATVDSNAVFDAAMRLCEKRRAMLLVDPPPGVDTVDAAADWISESLTVGGRNGAAYFPRLRAPDPLADYEARTFAPCGAVAGLYARTDTARGVWKAPAGTEARINGVNGFVVKLSDSENGVLNPLGLNCFRSLPIYGNVAWGARTLDGADARGSEWKYVPIRRLALMIEESVYRGTQWAVFEPNDEPLWAQLRLNLTSFMHGLFRLGAFQGSTPKEAYLVKCDAETTTQADRDRGIVNVLIGFAPLKPAEFVVIRIQQLAGQVQS